MGNRWKRSGKTGAFVLAAVLALQSTAVAAPLDELNAIFENQKGFQEESLLEEHLGIKEFLESVEENGVEISVDTGLLDGTAQLLELEEFLSEDASFQFHMQVDPKLKKWTLDAGAWNFGSSLLELALYGDTGMLALTIPQFYDSPVAVRAGSFLEQYMGSPLQKLVGEEEEIPDFDLNFYPESRDHDSVKTPEGKLQRKLQPMVKNIERSMQVEKETLSKDTQVYHVTFETDDLLSVYGLLMKEYFSVFTDSALAGFVTFGDVTSFEDEIDQMMDEMEVLMGDELTMNFQVEDDLIQKIDYEIFCDPDALNSMYDSDATGNTGHHEETYDHDTHHYDTQGQEQILEVTGFQGSIEYEILFEDPSHPWKTFDINMVMKDWNQQETASVWMTKQTETTDTTSETSVSMMVKEAGEVIYWDVPIIMTYDTVTGDLNASFTVSDEEEEVGLYLDSTFSQVEPGKHFVWDIHSLKLQADQETAGLNAQVEISAQAGTIDTPQNPQMFFELTQGDFLKLMTELSINVQNWSRQFEPETEYEYPEPETGLDFEANVSEAPEAASEPESE